MLGFHAFARPLGAVGFALAVINIPLAVAAQELPSYAQPTYVSTDETIHGRIRSVDGAFNISVNDDRGFVDRVQLHQGTIINPTGLTLSSGMSVTILGENAGSSFDANEIDTPYTYAGLLPTPVYYGPGYWCPGFGYGYGPAFSLAIVIDGGDRPWYLEHRPFYGRPWDGHGYFGGYVGRGSESRGRVEERRSFSNPSLRSETGARSNGRMPAAHVPSAFAQRSFAGESRTAERRGAAWNGVGPASARTVRGGPHDSLQAADSRGFGARGNTGRGPAPAAGGTGRWGGAPVQLGGGGAAHSAAPPPGGGGAAHMGAPSAGGGAAHMGAPSSGGGAAHMGAPSSGGGAAHTGAPSSGGGRAH